MLGKIIIQSPIMKDVDTRWGTREAKSEQTCEEDELKTLRRPKRRLGS